jgi:hypothetical protein
VANVRSLRLDVRRDIVIDVPRWQVWEYLADFQRQTEWSQPEHKPRIEPPSELHRFTYSLERPWPELSCVWYKTDRSV